MTIPMKCRRCDKKWNVPLRNKHLVNGRFTCWKCMRRKR